VARARKIRESEEVATVMVGRRIWCCRFLSTLFTTAALTLVAELIFLVGVSLLPAPSTLSDILVAE
jgi:hypothetical protein